MLTLEIKANVCAALKIFSDKDKWEDNSSKNLMKLSPPLQFNNISGAAQVGVVKCVQ